MINFNKPLVFGKEHQFVTNALNLGKFCHGGIYSSSVELELQTILGGKSFLVPSATAALELSALLLDCGPNDEIIMPSFTFVSTANAFALRGVKIVFADVNRSTLNIDAKIIERLLTKKTKAVVTVDYGGVGPDYEKIQKLCHDAKVALVTDSAQSIGSSLNGKPLISFGDIGCVSFHETKNIHCGEGGAIVVNNEKMIEKATIIRDKGTNRAQFLNGEVDKYTWQGLGSSYLSNELSAAFLYGQLQYFDRVLTHRRNVFFKYKSFFDHLSSTKVVKSFSQEPFAQETNGHMFFINFINGLERFKFMQYMLDNNIFTASHYIPLHKTRMGEKFSGEKVFLKNTEQLGDTVLRLPIWSRGTPYKKVLNALEKYTGF